MHLPDVRVLPIMTALLLAGPAIAKDDPTAPASTPTASSLPAGAKSPRASNKWRISFDESSKTDGQIIFRVWPKGSDPIEVSVVVRKGQQENSIARSARDAFKAVLGKAYGVETDDGEDVLIKVKGKTANFGLELVSSSAKDVDIDLDRE
jgi:hypothetical protein